MSSVDNQRLSDERLAQMLQLARHCRHGEFAALVEQRDVALALTELQALRASATEVEPVARPDGWMHPTAGWCHKDVFQVAAHCHKDGPGPIPLYAHPQGVTEWPEHASPLPWTYHRQMDIDGHHYWRDYIEDANGSTVVENIGHIDGPAICVAVNNRRAV